MAQADTTDTVPPSEVYESLRRGAVVLVDVREQAEHDGEHIEGSLLFPLSAFDPTALPKNAVLHCLSGKRSGKALALCRAAHVPVTAHMLGVIQAWKQAGLPTVP